MSAVTYSGHSAFETVISTIRNITSPYCTYSMCSLTDTKLWHIQHYTIAVRSARLLLQWQQIQVKKIPTHNQPKACSQTLSLFIKSVCYFKTLLLPCTVIPFKINKMTRKTKQFHALKYISLNTCD